MSTKVEVHSVETDKAHFAVITNGDKQITVTQDKSSGNISIHDRDGDTLYHGNNTSKAGKQARRGLED